MCDRHRITSVSSELSGMSAVIHFYLHKDPDEMDDEEFYKSYHRVEYILEKTGHLQS